MKRVLVVFLLALGMSPLLAVQDSQAQTSTRYKNAKSLIKKIKRAQRKLARVVANLNSAQVKSLNTEFSDDTDDSDADGIPDIIEDASGSDDCDADSDDDGLDDGDEVENETDPDDGADGLEIHALIDSLDAGSVTVGGETFAVVSSSEFLDEENDPIAYPDAFSMGDCVEAEGYYVGSVLTLDKLKKDDDCSA